MADGTLPPGKLRGTMVEMPAPCGRHVVNYPARLAQQAVQRRYVVFHTSCECGRAYMVATQPDGAHFRQEGTPEAIIENYEAVPWKEARVSDANGAFVYKEAPSLSELQAYFTRTRPS